jgi:plastocyanin
MRRITRLLVSVALMGVWLATAVPAQAGAATSAAKPTAKPKAAAVKLARIGTPAVRRPTVPARAQWWKHAKRVAKAKPSAVVALTIGVDAPTPAGHNWEYTAFFPETNVVVAPGAVVDFHWNGAASGDSFHSVTFLTSTENETQFRAANPFIVADNQGGETGEGTIQNNTIFNAQFGGGPPCGFVGFTPGPCVWNNSAIVSTGGIPNSPQSGAPSDFQVQINATAGQTYTYICAIHGNMRGTIHVGGTPTTQAEADAAAAAQYTTFTNAAAPVEAADLIPAPPVVNTNGFHTWTQKLGDEAGDVQFLEMLPPTLPIAKGDSVTFVNPTTVEIHTASFATNSTFGSVIPFGPPQCEGPPPSSPSPDTLADPTLPPPSNCGANTFEAPLNPAPLGEQTNITSGSTTGSSGILFPASRHTYTFPNNGNFGYFCFIHQGMFGAVYTPHYRETASDGGEFTFGGADFFGGEGAIKLTKPVVGSAETTDAQGYWHVASDGGIFAHGDAAFLGSMGGHVLNAPMVAIAHAPSPNFGEGYTTVASDGGVFSFGGAQFFGSMGGQHLNAPVVGIAPTLDGGGYWEVASDGGVFAFGDAPFLGSMGGTPLNAPVVGIVASGFGGYSMVASDGGTFNFDAPFFGSMGGQSLNAPMVGMSLTIDSGGYQEVASDGGVFAFGDAGFFGSMGGTHLNAPVVSLNGA